ncbi:unnamed protein product [Microthlaspi erraticum]|uniref:Uncharacterized protein n=1 Tax=Microthlaspi erraticum TaxID=1685480 RepID=A0A6D2JQZ5_9BRAS|nr:unnamed protein product [Microthlaspi erraticum]
MFRARPNVRPSEVSAKVQNRRPITHHDPGNLPAVGHAKRHATPRTTKAREPGSNASRPRNSSRVPRTNIRPTRGTTPASGREFIGQIQSARPRRPTVNPSDPDRSDSAHDRLSGRSSRTTVPTPRSTRSPFEAQTYVFKPGLTLAASRKT